MLLLFRALMLDLAGALSLGAPVPALERWAAHTLRGGVDNEGKGEEDPIARAMGDFPKRGLIVSLLAFFLRLYFGYWLCLAFAGFVLCFCTGFFSLSMCDVD